MLMILRLTKILRPEELLSADDLSAAAGGAFRCGQCLLQVNSGIRRASGLKQADFDNGLGGGTFHTIGESRGPKEARDVKTPSPKLQTPGKLQASNSELSAVADARVGICSLEFPWCLE